MKQSKLVMGLFVFFLFLLSACGEKEKSTETADSSTSLPLPASVVINFENAVQLSHFNRISGNWSIQHGKLYAQKMIASSSPSSSSSSPTYGLVVLKNFDVQDATMSISFSELQGSVGVVFRASSPTNYYVVRLVPANQQVELLQYVNGVSTLLAASSYAVTVLQENRMVNIITIDLQGSSLHAYINDDALISSDEIKETSTKNSRLGLWYQGSVVFDNFSAEKLETLQ